MKDFETLFTEYEARYSEENLRSKGREDGAKAIPSKDGASPLEDEVLNSARLLASKVAAVVRSKLEEIDAQIKSKIEKADRALKDEERRIQESFDANKKLQDEAFGLRSARDRFELGKRRFDITFSKTGRMPLRYVSHTLYLIFAGIIFLGEIPLNAMVFQIFGENQVMTWVMAFVIGLTIPLLAHFVGIKMREHPDGFHLPNSLKAIGVSWIVIVSLWGLSKMRHDYLFAMKDQLGLTPELVETSYLFFWLNLAVFGAATFLAYLSHDPVPGYDRLQDELKAAQKKLRVEEEKRGSALKWLEMDRVNQLAKARQVFRDTVAGSVELKGEYDKILIEGRHKEESCLLLARREIAIYRHENLRNRTDGVSPAAFTKETSFPLALLALKEKLDNDDHTIG